MKVLLIDNFDSFTYNLVHYLENDGATVTVIRNNESSLDTISDFDKIVISPGPGLPQEAGKLMRFIDKWYQTKPILGVCLGMQALAEFYGVQLYNLPTVKHGIAVKCQHLQNSPLFEDIPNVFNIGLYHSWAVSEAPPSWHATAYSEDNILMAMEHNSLPLYSVQFHPESILTSHGQKIINNFIKL